MREEGGDYICVVVGVLASFGEIARGGGEGRGGGGTGVPVCGRHV